MYRNIFEVCNIYRLGFFVTSIYLTTKIDAKLYPVQALAIYDYQVHTIYSQLCYPCLVIMIHSIICLST